MKAYIVLENAYEKYPDDSVQIFHGAFKTEEEALERLSEVLIYYRERKDDKEYKEFEENTHIYEFLDGPFKIIRNKEKVYILLNLSGASFSIDGVFKTEEEAYKEKEKIASKYGTSEKVRKNILENIKVHMREINIQMREINE